MKVKTSSKESVIVPSTEKKQRLVGTVGVIKGSWRVNLRSRAGGPTRQGRAGHFKISQYLDKLKSGGSHEDSRHVRVPRHSLLVAGVGQGRGPGLLAG